MQEAFTLSLEDRKIRGELHLPSRGKQPYVITCHGLFSSKESDKFKAIAERFTKAGLAVICFDFGGCGESSGCISETTVSRRLAELEAVARFAAGHLKLSGKFGILGSSLGGYVALLYAAKHPLNALCVWATPYDLSETGKNIPQKDLAILNRKFFTDAEKYALSSILSKINTVYIIQGKKDDIVPWQHAEKIFAGVQEPKELQLLPEGDHSITGIGDRATAISLSLSWFQKYFLKNFTFSEKQSININDKE